MAIVAASGVADFFGEVVSDAMRSRGLKASDAATSYVVALLADLAKPGSPVQGTLQRPLTLLLDEALQTPALADRFDKLRNLGDGVLYSSGFFADHFEARGVDEKYLLSIGRRAYEGAGSLLRNREQAEEKTFDIFAELAKDFTAFVSVLREVAHATVAKSVATSQGVLKMYERYMRTRSDSLGQALAAQGLLGGRGGARVFS